MPGIFSQELLEKITTKPYRYMVYGNAPFRSEMYAYGLTRDVDGVIEVLLSGKTHDKEKFDQIIKTLSECFNAEINIFE
jgi:acylphosphatase